MMEGDIMDRLTQKQSNFLKTINSAPIEFANLTEEEKSICSFLASKKYITYHTIAKKESRNGIFRSWNEIESISISESGKMYLINELLSDEQQNYLREQINSLNNIADSARNQADSAKSIATSAQQQAEIAVQQAQKANNTSLLAKIAANKSFILSLVSIGFTILINADKIVHNVQKILSYLNTLIH